VLSGPPDWWGTMSRAGANPSCLPSLNWRGPWQRTCPFPLLIERLVAFIAVVTWAAPSERPALALAILAAAAAAHLLGPVRRRRCATGVGLKQSWIWLLDAIGPGLRTTGRWFNHGGHSSLTTTASNNDGLRLTGRFRSVASGRRWDLRWSEL